MSGHIRLLSLGLKTIVVAGTVFGIFLIGMIKPNHDWDMIGYVAAAFHDEGYRGNKLSEFTYSSIEKEVSVEKFNELTSGYYRETVFNDPSALEQQIPLYKAKFAYVKLMRILNSIGFSYAICIYLISSLFSCAAALLILALLKRNKLSPLYLPIIVSFSGLISVARNPSPDAMASFASLTALYFMHDKNIKALIVAVILPIIRTDFLILSFLITAYNYKTGRKRPAIIAVLLSSILFIVINRITNYYGWLTIFNFTLIEINPYPATMPISVNPQEYLTPYFKTIFDISQHVHGLIFLISLVFLIRNSNPSKKITEQRISMIALSFVLFHLILYPTYTDRFFVFSAIVNLILIFGQLNLNIRNFKNLGLLTAGSKTGIINFLHKQRD